MEGDKIISLIWEDLKHNQLLNGLDSIGLMGSDKYLLSLDKYIAQMMGYTSTPDTWQDIYQQTMLSASPNHSKSELHNLAKNLFEQLLKIEKR